jgi:hypothetical protein
MSAFAPGFRAPPDARVAPVQDTSGFHELGGGCGQKLRREAYFDGWPCGDFRAALLANESWRPLSRKFGQRFQTEAERLRPARHDWSRPPGNGRLELASSCGAVRNYRQVHLLRRAGLLARSLSVLRSLLFMSVPTVFAPSSGDNSSALRTSSASTSTVDAMRVGLRLLAHCAWNALALHEMLKAARNLRRGEPTTHTSRTIESEPWAL